jgi:hypothetical protein
MVDRYPDWENLRTLWHFRGFSHRHAPI